MHSVGLDSIYFIFCLFWYVCSSILFFSVIVVVFKEITMTPVTYVKRLATLHRSRRYVCDVQHICCSIFFFLLCVRMQLQFACTQSMAISVFLRINWSISFSRKANTRTLPKDTNNLLSIRHTKIWMACNQFGRPRISWAVRSMDRSFVLFVFAKFCVWVASLKLSNVVRWWETRPNWYADKRVSGKMHK